MHVDSKIASKNQITLPKEVRDRLGVGAGDRIRYEIGDDGIVTVRKEASSFADLRGIIPYDGPPLTAGAIEAALDVRAGHHLDVLAEDAARRSKGAG